MSFLLDTVVISDLRKRNRNQNQRVVDWVGRQRSSDLFLSVLTIGEIEKGISIIVVDAVQPAHDVAQGPTGILRAS